MSIIKKDNLEHSFSIELATIVGIEKAILLKNISYWCQENERRNMQECFEFGEWWTDESLSSLERKYPYFKKPSIGRWMAELNKEGWVRLFTRLGGKNRYALGAVYHAWNTGKDWKSVAELTLSQNETPPALSQNETVTVSKWDTSPSQNETPYCLKMRRNNIDNIETSYIDSDVTRAREKKADLDVKKGASRPSSPPNSGRPPAPSSQPRLQFEQSPVFLAGPQAFETEMLGRGVSKEVDLDYYFDRLKVWGSDSGHMSADWLKKAEYFISDDQRKNCLRLKNKNTHANNSTTRNTGGNNSDRRTPTTQPDKQAIFDSAARILERRRKSRETFAGNY